MAGGCGTAITEPFLTGAIYFLDCSGRSIGAFGYAGLGATEGPGQGLVLAGLTLAIALFGLRLMFGERLGLRASVGLMARIALVLLLAFSWPAARTLFFDVAFDAPSQIASRMSASVTGGDGTTFVSQLQAMDDHIQALTAWGTGREELNSVRTASGQPAAQAFSGVAVSDRLALGTARVNFLVSAILISGGLRLAGGILFALLPLLAVFLLFRPTEGLIHGWARAMLAVVLAGAAGSVILGLETSFGLPWLSQRIAERAQSIATPGAPTELLVLTLVASLLTVIISLIIIRIGFAHFPVAWALAREALQPVAQMNERRVPFAHSSIPQPAMSPREIALAGSVSRLVSRETRSSVERDTRADLPIIQNGNGRALRAVTPARHQLRQSRAARLRSGI